MLRRLSLLFVLFAPAVAAQPSGAWEPTFAVPGVYGGDWGVPQGRVLAIAETDDLLCIGGDFRSVDFTAALHVACWDGSGWAALGGGTASDVAALAFGPDGALYVGGSFATVVQPSGTELQVNGIARWTGSVWEPLGRGLRWDVPEPGPGSVHALAFHEDALYVGGTFSRALNGDGDDAEVWGFTRWTGSRWEPLAGSPGTITSLASTPEGALYVGGAFLGHVDPEGTYAASAVVLEWTGEAFRTVGGVYRVPGLAEMILPTATGLYVGGRFGPIELQDGTTVAASNVALWDGHAWRPIGGGTSERVETLARDASGALYVGGVFTEVYQDDGTALAAQGLARWTGVAWEGFNAGPYGQVWALVERGGRLRAGGLFSSLQAASGPPLLASGIAERRADGTWSAVSAFTEQVGLNDAVTVVADDGCGGLVVGGTFTVAGSATARQVARWNGSAWSELGRGVGGNFPEFSSAEHVVALAPRSCGTAYVGGHFRTAFQPDGAPLPTNGIAFWNGTAWEPLGGGTNGVVYALVGDGSGVYVGGTFTEVYQPGGTPLPANHLARWTGSAWEAVGGGIKGTVSPSLDPVVRALALDAEGALYVGGRFAGAFRSNGTEVAAVNVAKWTGSNWEPLGDGIGLADPAWSVPQVNALAIVPGHGLYVGGWFQTASQPDGTALTVRNLARWDGAAWGTVGDGTEGHWVSTLAAWNPGGLIVAGPFRQVREADGSLEDVGGVALWDGSAWHPLGEGLAPWTGAAALEVGADGRLYVAGSLGGGLPTPYLSVWNPAGTTAGEAEAPQADRSFLAVYPNPLGPRATVAFALTHAEPARVRVYDLLGREVAHLAEGVRPAGSHEISFDAGSLPSGTYLVRLTTPTRVETRRVTVVR